MVREKQTGDVYALKVVRKEAAARRAACAGDERDVLAAAAAPCLPKLQYAFQVRTYSLRSVSCGRGCRALPAEAAVCIPGKSSVHLLCFSARLGSSGDQP